MRRSTSLFLLLGALGCGSKQHDPGGESAAKEAGIASTAFVVHGRVDAMRQTFGGTSVLPLASARFDVKPDGFHATFDGKTFAQAVPEVVLPRTAEAPFSIAHRGASLRVSLVGAKQAVALVDDGAVLYPSALEDATLLHVPTPIGNEDFVRFDARPASRELAYAVDLEGVAGLRLSASVLEMLDSAGDPLLHVAPPVAVDANGLAVVGELAVEGCAYDSSDAAPWGRAVTAPGASRCVVKVRWDDSGMKYPVLVDPAWTSAGTLATARTFHTTTLWGKSGTACEDATTGAARCVIVTGGENTISSTRTVYSTAEIYNRTTGTWASAGGFVGKRTMHAGAGTQKLIIAGGEDTLDQLSSSASYDGTTWTAGPALPGGKRRGLKAAQRGAFGVVFAGGESLSGGTIKILASSRKVDSLGVTAVAVTDMLTDRAYLGLSSFVHPCTACPLSYDVIAIGGIQSGGTKLATTEILSGTTWTAGPALTSARQRMALTYAGSWLYIVGGGVNTIDRFDRSSSVIEQWKPAGTAATLSSGNLTNMGAAALGPFATPRLLVAGGTSVIGYSTSDVFDLTTGVRTTTNMAAIHSGMDAIALDDGSVIVASGGSSFGGVTNTAERFVLQAKGAACTGPGECDSGFCVDGVCCESACGQTCESCNETGKAGTCTAVTGTPRGARTACPGITTGTCGNRCDGADRSKCNFPGGAVQCGPASCAGGVATSASFCDAAGTCKSPTTTPCGAYACGATACKPAPCASNADCATGFKCDTAGTKTCVSAGDAGAPCTMTSDCKPASGLTCVDGTCCTSAACTGGKKCNVPGAGGTCKLPYGTACTAATAADCPGGNCADGVCCDTPCGEQCAQCNLAGALKGHCSPVPAGGTPATGKPACSGTGACASRCDGTNVATCGAFAPPSTTCAAASCVSGTATPTRYCDGVGACAPATDKPCLAYVCGATDCKSTCATTADCATGYACKSGVCVTTGELGTLCDDGSQCKSGFCVGGPPGTSVCCSVASCDGGTYCADTSTPTIAGTCVKPKGATCATKADCGSGFCVDGLCCDALCDGQCEACDVAGAEGTCTGVKGAAHGARPKCFDGGTDVCTALQCDGSTRNKCVDFAAGPETECGALSCHDGVVTPKGRCDFKGACKPSTDVGCAPYLCDDKGCKTSCTSNADCAPKFACDSATGKCGSLKASCDGDGLGSIPTDGSGRHDCAPLRCNPATGDCFTTCTKTDDCAPGNVCGADGKCVAAAGETSDSGGCALSAPGRTSGSIALGLVALGLLARRRRARLDS